MKVMQVEWRGKNTKREISLLFFPQLLTPVALANCLLTKNGDCATVLIKVCGVGWGHSFRIPSLYTMLPLFDRKNVVPVTLLHRSNLLI